ncbi:MAG: ATP-dependent DNA ligase [Nitrososphaerota archaeon]|nr:ATP-dependent DNA ligase [Nitrososphaerota archaeon]
MEEKYTLFSELADLCEKISKTTKRLEKIKMISDFLKRLRREEISPAVLLIVGEIFPEASSKTLEIGFATISRILESSPQKTLFRKPLTILNVAEYFDRISKVTGPRSRENKELILRSMFERASELEVKYIVKNIFGEMQHGVGEGVMLEAIAKASNTDLDIVRRALMFSGNLGKVAEVALTSGEEGLKSIGLTLFHPIKPMLAQMAYSFEEVFEYHKTVALEYKFDGARVQIHKKKDIVRVFSRRLTEVTISIPEVVSEAVNGIDAEEAILDGEVIAVGVNGRPLPFQYLMRRFTKVKNIEEEVKKIPLKLYLFDVIYLEGKQLVDEPYSKRWDELERIVRGIELTPRIITSSVEEAKGFMKKALEEGHEGVVAKALNSPYTPGARGNLWFKLKTADYLDLVILGAQWGYGRRTGWLSDYFLAVLDEETGNYEIVGKTFKGLTDEEFEYITKRLLELKIKEEDNTVWVKPEIVVEVAYSEIQRSPKYRSGFALRFARITRIRSDKTPSEIDTLRRVKELYERQQEKKGSLEKQF